jgi:hypothetical protein
MKTPTRCRHCGDGLSADAPPGVTSCQDYARWRARQAGDMLPEYLADDLTVAIREGGDELPAG